MPFLTLHNEYNVDNILSIVIENNLHDALVYLNDRIGNIDDIIDVSLKHLSEYFESISESTADSVCSFLQDKYTATTNEANLYQVFLFSFQY